MTTKPGRFCYRAWTFASRAEVDGSHGDGRTLEGYAAVFGEPTRIDSWEGVFDEAIAPGAFRKTLRERTPVLQFDHGHDARTGSVPIGSLVEIREDDHGLYVSARLYDNPVVEPIRQAIEGGSIDGMSFRFRVLQDAWTDRDGKPVKGSELSDLLWSPGDRGPLLRTIREVELFELGPVVFPAYESTTVGVRSMLAQLDERQREALVRQLLEELSGHARSTVEESDAAGDAEEASADSGGDDVAPAASNEPGDDAGGAGPVQRSGPLPPLNEWLAAYRKRNRSSEPA